jgi:hypothetical protein
MELVLELGFLPLAIIAVARQLRATDEPLSKFVRSYSEHPNARGLGAFSTVVQELQVRGVHEALNLMKILCFFSQHVPVEMIHLGSYFQLLLQAIIHGAHFGL